jgi:hypothetical protein
MYRKAIKSPVLNCKLSYNTVYDCKNRQITKKVKWSSTIKLFSTEQGRFREGFPLFVSKIIEVYR